MMLQDEQELRHSYQMMGKLQSLRDRCATEPLWSEELREDVVAGIEAQMRKIEREIVQYLAKQHPRAMAA